MKKMPALNLEIIHFNTEDIIVTSGIPSPQGILGIPISNNVWYATIGSELNEDPDAATDNNISSFKDGKKYLFKIGEQGSYTVNGKFGDNLTETTTYAWHCDYGWFTGDLLAGSDDPISHLSKFDSTYFLSN